MVQEIEIVEVDIDGRSFRVRPLVPMYCGGECGGDGVG